MSEGDEGRQEVGRLQVEALLQVLRRRHAGVGMARGGARTDGRTDGRTGGQDTGGHTDRGTDGRTDGWDTGGVG